MKISYNWLKSYLAVDLAPEVIGNILTDTGLEVEGIETIETVQGGLEGVVVGEVIRCEKHPDADRLKVTLVNIGSEELQIVCGASNVAVGQKVVVATNGCTLYPKPDEPFKIKKSKIRGVESNGMLCAEDELGIGSSHDGILVLDANATIGTPAADYFELENDYVFEIGLTPNRSDAMGHLGVARDLRAYLNVHENKNLELNMPDISSFAIGSSDFTVDVSVQDKERCPRYMGITIGGVTVHASPAWLQKRLRAVGLSPINAIVDVTNYVMLELGTPLHAFDLGALHGKIEVKCAAEGEKFVTLDGTDRTLSQEDLMITNGSKSLCIAGVFGGLESGITEKTKDLFLESAYFDSRSIRKTAKRHGLSTDASFRFERGTDPELTAYALKRAACLITEISGGQTAMQIFDSNPKPVHWQEIEFDLKRCESLIGNKISKETILSILKNLDFKLIQDAGETVKLAIPPYRVDVTREVDVIEEVLRIYGFNRIVLPEKMTSTLPHFSKPDPGKIQKNISELLVGMGFYETLNNSLTKSAYLEFASNDSLNASRNVRILNPLSQELDVLRQTLIFNLLENTAHNQNRQSPDLKLFEFGKVYHNYASGFVENKRLILAISGRKESESWNASSDKFSFYSIKGITMALFDRLGLSDQVREKELENALLCDGVQLSLSKRKVGEIGWIDQVMKKQFGIKGDVFVADLDWDAILDALNSVAIKYKPLPKAFAVRRDFSLLLDEQVRFSDIVAVSKSVDNQLLKEVGLFDVYEGKNLEPGKKSYAVSFRFQDQEKTLKDDQIDGLMSKIRHALESKLNIQLRG